LVTDAVEKADALNDFFASVFRKEDELEKSKLYDEGTPMSHRDGRTEDLTQHDRALQNIACTQLATGYTIMDKYLKCRLRRKGV